MHISYFTATDSDASASSSTVSQNQHVPAIPTDIASPSGKKKRFMTTPILVITNESGSAIPGDDDMVPDNIHVMHEQDSNTVSNGQHIAISEAAHSHIRIDTCTQRLTSSQQQWLSIQKDYYIQQVGNKFLEADRNTLYFHTMENYNIRRYHISAVQGPLGIW